MSVERIYDFETVLEAAFTGLLTDADLTALNPASEPELQKAYPRVELAFQVGSAKQSYHIVDGVKRNATWTGQLAVMLFTECDSTGKSNHRAYRAAVRNAMAGWAAITMDCHKLQNVIEQSTTPEYKPAEGYETSRIIYQVDFGVDSGAWVEL